MRFLLGTSYFSGGKGGSEFREELLRLWVASVLRLDVKPERVVVVCENDSLPVREVDAAGFETLGLPGDLGHVGQHLNGSKRHEFTGWSSSMLLLAMAAYTAECDFVYSESDNLVFGPIIKRTYEDLGTACMVFGRKMTSPPWMPCAQAWFLIRHAFIPTFVSTYLRLGRDGDVRFLGEQKFIRLEERFGGSLVRRLSFGTDRERPIPWDDEVFYFQQPTPEEIAEGRARGKL